MVKTATRAGFPLRVLSLHYQLAPKAHFPTPIDTIVDAYDWLIQQCGVPAHHIVLMGDSAGGGLCLSVATKIRDTHRPKRNKKRLS